MNVEIVVIRSEVAHSIIVLRKQPNSIRVLIRAPTRQPLKPIVKAHEVLLPHDHLQDLLPLLLGWLKACGLVTVGGHEYYLFWVGAV